MMWCGRVGWSGGDIFRHSCPSMASSLWNCILEWLMRSVAVCDGVFCGDGKRHEIKAITEPETILYGFERLFFSATSNSSRD